MKVLIVGAGIGGLTLGAFLKNSAVEFEIVEKSNNTNTQGFSLGLWNNGRHILSKLGLADKFDKEGSRIRNYRICDGKGNLLLDYNLHELYSLYGVAYTHIHRNSLHNWLLDLVGKEKIQLDTHIKNIFPKEKSIQVEFHTGKIKNYDMVVGADGIHSQVRNLIFKKEYEIFDDWRVWYAWIDNSYKQNATVTEYIEPGEFVGVFDVGDKTLAVLIAPAKHGGWDDAKGRLERLKNIFKDESKLAGFLEGLKDEDVVPTDFSHVKMKTFIKSNIALLGDAAHGFEPHAGLGAGMAMEDAYVLAGELMKVSESYSIKEALTTYQKMRKSRVAIARTLTNRMRGWAFIKSKWLRRCINFIIPFVPQKFITNQYNKLLQQEI